LRHSATLTEDILESNAQITGAQKEYLGVTFQPNKNIGIHRWYPYVEGFSGGFVSNVLNEFGISSGMVFDPFGGCGTTAVVASLSGIESVIIDVNPFMCFVTGAKTQRYQISSLKQVKARLKRKINSYTRAQTPKDNLSPVFEDKNYFSNDAIYKIRFLKQCIGRIRNISTCDFFKLALASILVKVSKLKRAPDLKYKRDNEDSPEVFQAFLQKLDQMQQDVVELEGYSTGATAVICDNIIVSSKLSPQYDNSFDIVITSPPYLNGTNYCRNTKLELWVFDYLESVKDLRELRKQNVTAGINSTQMGNGTKSRFPKVQKLVDRISENAYDRRIPVMVAAYFNEMESALKNIYRLLKSGHYCVLVIGDSFFGDTHIPTDVILGSISERIGFRMEDNRIVRIRKSRGGFPLHESILILRKKKNG
jgi:DNA modification methylase